MPEHIRAEPDTGVLGNCLRHLFNLTFNVHWHSSF